MKNIIIPTDFSKNAWNAATYAMELFKHEECHFYLLNAFTAQTYVTENMMIPEPGNIIYEAAHEGSETALNDFLEKVQARCDAEKHTFETASVFNFPVDGINNFIEDHDIDFVVMGTKGETNAKGIFAGSVAVSAMKKIKECPVLVIPENAMYTYVKEIVFPTDYETDFHKVGIETLADMARRCKAEVSVLHIFKDKLKQEQLNNKSMLTQFLATVDSSFHEIREKKVLDGLHEYIDTHDSGMVAFVNKQHNFFEGLFSTPIEKELGYYSKIPVLALHEKE